MACYDLLSRDDLILSIKLLKQKLYLAEGERELACIECSKEHDCQLDKKNDRIYKQNIKIAELKKFIKYDRNNREDGD